MALQKRSSITHIKNGIQLKDISLLGVLQGLICLPLEHPFDTLKTWMQSQNQRVMQAVASIREKKGLKGFYSGFTINSLRVVSKNAYRWPLNVFLMSHFRKVFAHFDNARSIAGAATGLMTAMVESVVVCPFERVKVWLMTSPEYQRFGNFIQLHLRSLFDGLLPVLLKQSVSWVSFLASQEYFKGLLFKHYNATPETYELTTKDLTIVSLLVCLCNTACVMPVDFVKTHYQKFSNSRKGTPISAFILEIYRTGGLRHFYRGGAVKIIQYNINAFFSVQLFQRVLRAYDRK